MAADRRQALPHRGGEERAAERSSATSRPAVRIGVVAFGPSAVIVQPPTLRPRRRPRRPSTTFPWEAARRFGGHPHLARRHRRQDPEGQHSGARRGQLGRGQHRLLRRGDDRAVLRRRGHEPGRPGDDGAVGVDRGRPRPDHRRRHRGRHDGADRRFHASPRPWTAKRCRPWPRSRTARTTKSTTQAAPGGHLQDDQPALRGRHPVHRDHGASSPRPPPCSSSPAR